MNTEQLLRLRLGRIRQRLGDRPMHLDAVKKLRSPELFDPVLNSSLYPLQQEITCDGSHVSNARLATLLEGTEIGWYSLMYDSIDYLGHHLAELRPENILEFGSGISTLCLAVFMDELGLGGGGICISSLEQNEAETKKTLDLVSSAGLGHMLNVMYSPLVKKAFEGGETEGYSLDRPEVVAGLGEMKFDFVLVDGPMGPPGCRVTTLPGVMEQLDDGCRFLMDDALRDPEIDVVASGWDAMGQIDVEGILFKGKGYLAGRAFPGRPA